MKKVIGRVSEEERDEVRNLHSRKYALIELAKLLSNDSCMMYEEIVSDLANTTFLLQEWWNTKADLYKWESSPNGHWSIDFKTCLIYLIDES